MKHLAYKYWRLCALCILCGAFLSSCSSAKNHSAPPANEANFFSGDVDYAAIAAGEQVAPSMESAGEQLAQVGHNWLYGPGFGKTAITVGAIILFPPYALYLAGNVGLAMAGYETMDATKLLPDEAEEQVNRAYDGFASVPGRFNAKIAGKEFYDPKEFVGDEPANGRLDDF